MRLPSFHSRPRTRMLPSSRGSSPASERSTVVFPDPLGPNSTVTAVPSGTVT